MTHTEQAVTVDGKPKGDRDEGRRRIHNRKLAIKLANAGVAILPVLDKTPLARSFHRLDTTITDAERSEIIDNFAQDHEGREPIAIGSTRDVSTIKKIWAQVPDAVPGISGGPNNLLVLDVDAGGGKDGPKKLRAWLDGLGVSLPTASPVTLSQSGGAHIFFRDDQQRGNTEGVLKALDVNVRGRGGFVVAPGAWRRDGKRYQSAPDAPKLVDAFAAGSIPPVPQFIAEAIETRIERDDVSDAEKDALAKRLRDATALLDFDDLRAQLDIDAIARDNSTFAAIWRYGETAEEARDGTAWDFSKQRMAFARTLHRALGDKLTPEALLVLMQNCDGCGSFVERLSREKVKGEFSYREVAREYATTQASDARERSNGDAFGAVDDDDDELDADSDTPAIKAHKLRKALKAFAAMCEDGEVLASDASDLIRCANAIGGPQMMTLRGYVDAAVTFSAFGPEDYSLAGALAKLRGAVKTMIGSVEPDKKRNGLSFEMFDEAAAAALDDSERELVEGLLDHGAMSVVYGESNAGKSFVLLDIAFKIATGTPWNGGATDRGLVVYVAAEGGKRFRRRLAALRKIHGREADRALFALVPSTIDLRDPKGDTAELIKLVRAAEAQTGVKCFLIVVDTLARAMAGGDENSSVDMGAVVMNGDAIREATGAHVAYVHHSGKDRAKGSRGWSGLRAATDTEIEVVANASKTGGTIKTRKQRDKEFGPDVNFMLEGVKIGEGANGKPLTSAVVKIGGAADRPAFVSKVKLTGREADMMAALTKLASAKARAHGIEPADVSVSLSEIGAEMDAERAATAGTGEVVKPLEGNHLRNIRNRLKAKAQVRETGRGEISLVAAHDASEAFAAADDDE